MDNKTRLQDFTVGGTSAGVSGSNSYKFQNFTSTPMVYTGSNPSVAAAIERAEAERTGSYDPYTLASNKAYSAAYSQAPKVGIANGKITVSAPQEILDTPYYKQLNQELQSLKGADLNNPEIRNAIDKLNEEIQTNFQEIAVKNTIGWSLEELNDYQNAMQTVRSTNPMKSSNLIKGTDKEGNVTAKTPQDWVKYWRELYNTDERVDALIKSSQAKNPYERTMYLVLTQGTDRPVYGFDTFERLGQGFGALANQLSKFPEGTFRTFVESGVTKWLEQDQRNFNIPLESFVKNDITNEAQFSERVQNLWGKKWEDLSDDDKAFVLFLSRTTKEDEDDRDLASKARTRLEQLSGLHKGKTLRPEIQNMDSADAVARVLFHSSYDDYRKLKDDYITWQNYEEDRNQDDERLAKNAIMSSAEQGFGNLVGSIGRYLWEAAVIRGLTGANVNAISDKLGEGIVGTLASKGFSPASRIGQNVLRFTAELAGTIPEDILQTSIDNVLTYNSQDNANLLDKGQISENLLQNFVVMSLFNAARTGVNAVKRSRMAKKLAQQADLNQIMDIEGIATDIDDLSRAIENNNEVKVDSEKVSVVDENGKETVLENITPEQGNMIRTAAGVEPETKFYNNRAELYAVLEKNNAQSATQYLLDAGLDEVEFQKRLESLPESVQDTVRDQIDKYGNPGQYDDMSFRKSLQSGTSDLIIDNEMLRAVTKATDLETPKVDTSKIETEASKTEIPEAEKVDYGYTPLNGALNTPVELNDASIRDWHTQTHNRIMSDFDNNFINKFHNKFGDVQASDFDWVWYQSKQGKTPSEIVGTVDPTTNRTVTQNMIDAMEWWADQPQTKALRKASRDALDFEGDFNILGYLPHTDYNPTYVSFDEALSGVLWRTSTGASIMDEGNYKGYGGDFRDRYSTFVSNMLWDARSKDVATAKLLDEARMDGQEITPELEANARKVVDGEQNIRKIVNDSDSTKAVMKALESTSEDADEIDWKKIDDETKKQAEKSGLGQAIHDNYSPVYYGANSSNVGKQGNTVVNNFDTLGNRMRNTTIGNGMSMYDWGGADIVYAPRNAIDVVNRYLREGGDFRDMLQEYVESHSHRSAEYAEEVVDRWMGKLGELAQRGPLTKAKVIQSLSTSMKWEGFSRLRKWLVMANYDQFNSSTKKMIDRFLFNHMQMDAIKESLTLSRLLTKGLNVLTSFRYRALFYGNIKNALLQVSELNRYFSSFKWGDVATMAKRLATDESFRARVNDYVQSVAPMTNQLKSEIYQAYSDVADNMKVEQNGVTFKSLGKKAADTADMIGLAPIEAAESFKNRMMVAGLVQEADRLGLTGDEALRYIRNRFERVALAADEMGRIGMASNPLARTMLFLQNFQIRELGMHLYNIKDATGMAKSVPGKVLNATKYLTKVFGAKLATTLIMARLGYSASQTMGLDPFGLLDQYNQLDEEDRELPDYFFMSPFFSGGMTSLIADMYFMARKAYENSNQETISEEAEQRLEPSWGLAMPDLSFDNMMGGVANFVPGNVFFNRLNQMNEMMNTGWATSTSGNKVYTAPSDVLNTVLGYLFGRSATQNAQQYNQTYGGNLWQTLGRFNPFRSYSEFDPIDTKNYTDWFKGDSNDAQQFNKGIYWFRDQRDRIIDVYEDAIRRGYSDSEIAEAKNNMNQRLEELYDSLERFVDAYEKKNGTITSTMVKQVVNVLNTGRKVLEDTEAEAKARSLEQYNEALSRYSALGLSPVGTYTGATISEPKKETRYQGSPQYRSATGGYYDRLKEVVDVLKQADATLEPLRETVKQSLSDAYSRKDYDTVTKIQYDYLDQFDQVVSPIIAAYGNGVLSSTDVVNQLKDMLSTGTTTRSGNLIPSDQYAKDKYGRYRSMPYESVDVKKWAQERFSGDLYNRPSTTMGNSAQEDLAELGELITSGQNSRARAKALLIKTRVDNQTYSVDKQTLSWLNNYLKGE